MKLYVVPTGTDSKWDHFKWKVKMKAQEFGDWFNRNKEVILTLAPALVGGAVAIIKVAGKQHNLHKEEELKDLYCYDRSLGHYWALRRELSNKEWLEIDSRKNNGEKLGDILKELNVLK